MSELTFSELQRQAYRLYKAEAYAQALDLVSREFPHFREQAHHLYFWRACLACRVNQTEQALELLAEAVSAGYWYSKLQLRDDPDLEPLQGLPRFEELAGICLERQAAAQAAAVPRLITLEPAAGSPPGGPPWPLLLALHGNNSTAEAAAEHWSVATALGCLVALPGSSQVGGPGAAYRWDDWAWAEDEIQSHLATLEAQYAVDAGRVVLGGFSMGAGLAVWLALTGTIGARGFVAVGPYAPDVEQLVAVMGAGAARGVRGYLIVGEQDEDCYEITLALAGHLRAQNIPCELEMHPDLDHDYPAGFEKSLARALEFILER